MTPLAIGTMIGICGLVWGGLVTLAIVAARCEGRKRRDDGKA